MNESNPPPFPPQPPPIVRRRKGLGCFSVGCLIVILVLGVAGVGFGSLLWVISQGGQAYVSEQQVLARTAPATDEQYQAVLAKLAPFGQAMNEGHAATLEITPDDLNVLIARSPQFDAWRGRLFLAAKGDQLVADVSTPLTDDQTRHLYFSGRATLDASYASDGFVVFLRHIEPLNHGKGNTRFDEFLNYDSMLQKLSQLCSQVLNDGFHQQATQDPATADLLRKLRTVIVQNGQIVITTKELPGTVAPNASPAATPVATDDNQT